MERFAVSPTDPGFVQDPYPIYDAMREAGPLAWWDAYDMPVAAGHATVSALLRDRRFGRENPDPPSRPPHQAAFWRVEDHSMLESEPPRHTRLRAQVLRAFTSRRVGGMAGAVRATAHALIDAAPAGPFDLLDAVARPLPVRTIARLLGVPEADAPALLEWSHAMVGMYRAGRTRADEDAAANAAAAFADYLAARLRDRAAAPRDDLITHLLAVEADGILSRAETVATCILLLNAGHEATVHTLGNAVAGLCGAGLWGRPVTPATVEEVMRHDPPLHLFVRYAKTDAEAFGHRFRRGDRVGLLLGAANRDPALYPRPDVLRPDRYPDAAPHLAFGAGIHFCLGAPLARLELLEALTAMAERWPAMTVTAPPRYADIYHFHGLETLTVRV